MLFLVLLAVGTATAAPALPVHVLTEPPRDYVIVEPVPEAPIFPPIQYGIVNQDQKAFDERSAPGNNVKPENVAADDAPSSEDDADNANPQDDDGNDAKAVDDDANDAKPDASEHHEEQSETEKQISSPDESKIPSPPEQVVIPFRPVVIRMDDTAPSAVSWLPSFIPAFQLPSLSSIPGLSGLSLPSLPSLSSLSLPSLPSLSSIGLPSLSSLNLPSISNFNLSNLSNFNIPGLSSIFGSSPKGRYLVYRSY